MTKNLIIRASAGTGKTYRLSNRYIELLLDGVRPENILATTFTVNAAGEILERILRRLAEGVKAPAKLSEAIYGDQSKLSQEKILETLAGLVKNLHRVRVSTIDSFFGQSAANFAAEIGLPMEWNIGDEAAENRNRELAVQAAFQTPEKTNIRDLVFDFFKGESKRTLTQEITDLLKLHRQLLRETEKEAWFKLPDEKIPPISEYEKAGIREKILGVADVVAGAITERDLGFLRSSATTLVNDFENERWDSIYQNTIFQNVIFRKTRPYHLGSKTAENKMTPAMQEAVRRMEQAVQRVEKILRPRLLALLKKQTESAYKLFSGIENELEEIKAASGEYTFDDVTFRLARYIEHIKQEQFNFRLDGKISHLLLDEFQDTSLFQWKILESIADSIILGNAGKHPSSFFCVGDTKQSIYQWRGGMPEIFDAVEKKYCDEKKCVEKECLAENWRSSPVIIETVNQVFERITDSTCLIDTAKKPGNMAESIKDEAKKAAAIKWASLFPRHRHAPKNKELKGFVSLEVPPRFEDLPIDRREEIHKKWKISFTSPKELCNAYIARRIADIHQSKPNASIGVLFRSGRALSEIAQQLKRIGIEVSQEGGTLLTTAASVRAVLALLRIADHPGDTYALLRIATLTAIKRKFAEMLDLDGSRLADKHYAKELGLKLSAYVRDRIMTVGLGSFVRETADTLLPYCNDREREKLHALVNSAFRFESSREIRIDRFIRLTEARSVSLPSDSNLRLVTIHASKGLEYDVVILPELGGKFIHPFRSEIVIDHRPGPTERPDQVVSRANEGAFPLLPNIYSKAYRQQWQNEINESLNILYVAMTRAKRELIMIVDSPGPKNEGKGKKSESCSFQDILLSMLNSGKPSDPWLPFDIGEEIILQKGDPTWQDTDRLPPMEPQKEPALIKVGKTDADTPFMQTRAPSGHGFNRNWVPASYLFDRGTAIHACFEKVEWLDSKPLDEEELKEHLRVQDFHGKATLKNIPCYIESFRRICEDPVVRKVLSPSSYTSADGTPVEAEVHRERSFLAVTPGKHGRLKGRIDRLVILREKKGNGKVVGADIIDYKTSSVDCRDSEKLKEYVGKCKYDEQLNSYREEVMKQYGLSKDQVSARLLFVHEENNKPVGFVYTVPPPFETA